MKNIKALEGKTVYLLKTGNNARHNPKEPIVAVINKVARVFVTFTIDGYSCAEKLRFHERTLRSEHNSGYVVFTSKESFDQHFEKIDLAKKISGKFRYPSDYEKLDIEKLKEISEILDL